MPLLPYGHRKISISNREGAQIDSIWCGFGAALVSIRIQFGLGLDLNRVMVNMLTCLYHNVFPLSCQDLESFWSQSGFRLASIRLWICFGFVFDQCTPLL